MKSKSGKIASWMRPIKAKEPSKSIKTASQYCWSPFQRDFAQITHSDFFKRLSGKTQVHSFPDNDHIRTRLTHSIEASQIGRHIARYFSKKMHDHGLFNDNSQQYLVFSNNLEEITAAACLLHDVGHPPFGHTGAHTLHSLSNKYGEEFDDNKQVFRIALNPVWYEKFDPSGPLVAAAMKKNIPSLVAYKTEQGILSNLLAELNLTNARHPASLFMEAADDIAYIAADLTDYLRYSANESNLQKMREHANIKDLVSIPVLDSSFKPTERNMFGLLVDLKDSNFEQIQIFTSNLIKGLLFQVFKNIDRFFNESDISDQNEIPKQLKDFTEKYSCENDPNLIYLTCHQNGKIFYQLKKKSYKEFILVKPHIGSQNLMAKKVLTELFTSLEELISFNYKDSDIFKIMPSDFQAYIHSAHDPSTSSSPARIVLDFISGMTDEYALKTWETIHRPHALKNAS